MFLDNGVEFSLKVLINKEKNKVLFAEVDSDFAEVVLSFLTLPLGKIVRVLKKHYGDKDATTPFNIGSLTTLYDGLSNLDGINLRSTFRKSMLLNPVSSFQGECRKLKLDISDPLTARYFSCPDWNCTHRWSSKVAMRGDTTVTCLCGKTKNKSVYLDESETSLHGSGGVFTIKTTSFLISDDLRMVPNLAVGFVQTLGNLGITDTKGAELRNVTFGFNEVMDLLKGSLTSRTPLTDLILNKTKVYDDFARLKYEAGISFQEKENLEATKKMNLRLVVKKSNNKLLFAQGDDDFVDLLFSFLTIPLGGVECLLGSNSCLKSIDNLYKSVVDFIDDKYWVSPSIKNRVMKPNLPKGYVSEGTILPLSEQVTLYYHRDMNQKKEWLSYSIGKDSGLFRETVFRRGQENFVRGTKMYMVTDDLTVTPMCMTSTLSILKKMEIPLSDVKEVEVRVGLQEALSILKASLTSTSALTDGLKINSMFKKQPNHARAFIRRFAKLFN
ncbi:hypothetical protein ABFS82_06G129100 [Erythranthe guttata]|uniref:uncharacterized protein LOC105960429 isoform X2 n=1 Tax=Erythranthe guttata TaxID=4155 RepID=UPI00064DA905|nr:PREDICTED: uncharacterized protein LOC105960429 isoform X2 [Erythranthe guttata]|eukprot:XP_012840056.1 PREDICTED: uncharacterized protein LOC105960429 isoform X2 [Erythranthe guttata]